MVGSRGTHEYSETILGNNGSALQAFPRDSEGSRGGMKEGGGLGLRYRK